MSLKVDQFDFALVSTDVVYGAKYKATEYDQ